MSDRSTIVEMDTNNGSGWEQEKGVERVGKDLYARSPSKEDLQAEVEKSEKDKYLVEFNEDDLDNPKNFNVFYKWYLSILSGIFILNATFASSAPSTATAEVMAEFNKSQEVAILMVSLFLAGYVFGPLLWAPAADIVGRKPVFLVSLLLYVIFNIPIALAPNITCLLICRLICGIASASSMTNSGGVLSDIWDVTQRGKPMAVYSLSPFLGPVFGPIFGGLITYNVDYHWIWWVMMIFGGVCLLAALFTLPETFPPLLLRKKAQRLRKETGDNNYYAFSEKYGPPFKEMMSIAFARPIKMMFTEPIIIMTSIYVAVVYGVLYLTFELFPYVFKGIYQFNTAESGLTFISVGIGLGMSFVTTILFDNRYQRIARLKIKETGQRPASEIRMLPAIFVGGPAFIVGLFWFSWTARSDVHWMAPTAAGAPIGAGVVLIFISFLSYLSDAYTQYASSALAANTIVRSIFGAVFPLFATQMFDGLGVNWSGTLLALIGVILLPFPILFHRYGTQIRKKSAFARS